MHTAKHDMVSPAYAPILIWGHEAYLDVPHFQSLRAAACTNLQFFLQTEYIETSCENSMRLRNRVRHHHFIECYEFTTLAVQQLHHMVYFVNSFGNFGLWCNVVTNWTYQ